MRQLYYGDNLEILRNKIKTDSVDLCYIDPPFNSKRTYNQIYNNLGSEDKAQAQAFVDMWTWDVRADEGFDEIESNNEHRFTYQTVQLILGLKRVLGKGSLMAYIISMTLRIQEIHRVLKNTGSFYLHCDPTANHYLKLVMDSIFIPMGGEFQNEIIWHYRRWTGKAKKWQELHDNIYFYTKGKDYTFNVQYVAYTEGSKDRKEQGVLHRFKEGYEPFLVSDGTIDEKGVRDNDVWQIPFIAPSAKERLGYPTQKPEKLLEKVIKASSNEDDLVLDAYCGCGTTIAVAEELNRQWIGIDITYQSISLILKRLHEAFPRIDIKHDVNLDGIPKDMSSARALAHKIDDRLRKEFEKWCVLTFSENKAFINEKKGGDKGIDGKANIVDLDEKGKQIYKEIIFSVKSEKTITPQRIREFYGTIQREKAPMGYFITLEEPNKNIYTEARSYGKYHYKPFGIDYPVVEIITVKDLMNGKRMTLPVSQRVEILKKAKAKLKGKQLDLEIE